VKSPEDVAAYNPETIKLAYEASIPILNTFSEWADSIDTKIVALFGVASVIVTLTPTLYRPDAPGALLTLWALGVVSWGAAAWACYQAYKPRPLRVGPNAEILLTDDWLARTPHEFQYARLHWLAGSYKANRDRIREKVYWFDLAIKLVAAEVLLLSVAMLLSPRPDCLQ
jgi:hypothetical protein